MSEIDDESYDKTMNTNVKSNHWLINMVSPSMKESGGGSIMITSSIAAFDASETLGTYSISKLAVLGLVRNYASELGPSNIRVNALSAGPMKTLAMAGISGGKDMMKWSEKNSLMNRNIDLEDVGKSGLYLLSDLSSGVTGETHYVDCGYNIVGVPKEI